MKHITTLILLVLCMGASSLTAASETPDCFPNCGGVQVSDIQIGGGMQMYTYVIDIPRSSQANHKVNGIGWYGELAFQGEVAQIQFKYSQSIGDITKDADIRLEGYKAFNVNLNLTTSLDNYVGGFAGVGYNIDHAKHINYNHELSDSFLAQSVHGQVGAWINFADIVKLKIVGFTNYFFKDNLVDLVQNGNYNDFQLGAEAGLFFCIPTY